MTKRDIIRYSFVFLTFLGVFSTYPKAVHQARAEEPAGDVIYISTPEEFQNINSDLTAHYEIINDIDFTGFVLSPIAVNNDFTGIINGNNFRLSNIGLIVPNNFGAGYYGGNQEFSLALLINNNGKLKNIILENIFFTNDQNGSIKLKTLDLNYKYSFSFSLFVKTNKTLGIIENISINLFNFTLIIGTENYNYYSDQYYKIDFLFSLFIESNYGEVLNINLNFYGNGYLSINGGYRRETQIEFSMINVNYSVIENIRLYYGGYLFISNEENATSSTWYYEGKVIYSSLFLHSNQGSVTSVLIFTELYLGLTVFGARNLAIYFSIFSNYQSFSNTTNIRIINFSKFNFSIDHNGFGNSFFILHDLFSNITEYTNISNVLIENNESLKLDFLWRTNSSSGINVSQLGSIINESDVKKIIISGKPKYEFVARNILYWIYFNISLSDGGISNDAYFDFILINLLPVIYINSTDQTLINTFISSKTTFKVTSFQYFNNTNIFSYVEYIFLASKLPNYETSLVGIDGSIFGIWNKINLKYYKQDSSFKSPIIPIDQLIILLNLDSSWSQDQITNDGFPILTFTIIEFEFNNRDVITLNDDFFFDENINVTLNNQELDSGTHFLNYLGIYEFVISDLYTLNKLDVTTNSSLISSYQSSIFFESFIPVLTGILSAKLNGDPYTIGTPITTPGLHTLTIFGENGYEQDITFTIVLETDGVTDESTYTDSVTPTFSGGTATLDGEPFESGTEITDVGNYTLIIVGVNGFSEEINFQILPVITGLQDGVTEDPGFQPNITGEGITLELNGDPYTIGTPITTPGLHTLTIFGENGYEQDITFTIRLIFNGVTDNQTVVNNFVTITFSGGTARLNGTEIQSGFTTNKLGKYRLVIYGVGELVELDYDFTILPDVQGLNNLIYTGNVQPNISGNSFSMTLNGVPYAGGNITMPGDHQLVIYGYTLDNSNQNEVMYTKNFRINVRVQNVANGENYLNQSKTIIISGGNATLNGQSIGLSHLVNSIGHYSLVITGVNGYSHEVNFTISPEINGVDNGQEYTSSTNIQILGVDAQIILNGNPITNGILTYPGQHELVIRGVGNFEVRRTFNIVATIEGVENEAVYLNEPKTITFSGGDATLNGTPIQSGYVLNRIGHFELTITGVNGYSLTYAFTNLPEISGVEDDVQYTSSTNIQILGSGVELLMNGQPFTNRVYSEPGQHELEIFAAGDYYQSINFRIKPTISGGVLDGEIYINTSVNIVISGGNPTLNGVAIPLNHVVNEVGNYTLIIPQNNLPNVVITFTINPALTKLSNNRTYNGSITPTIVGTGMTITLNGRPYVSDTAITNPGSNIIRITSLNGNYEMIINFTVNLVFSGLVDGVTYYDLITPTFSGGVVTLNGEPFESNTTITTLGEFELLIIGDNNYSRSYSFTILPYNMSFPQDGASREEVDLKIFRVHSLTEITLNDVDIRQTRLIQSVGHYDLVISFDGIVISDTRFTVEPQDYVQDGSEFTSPISIHHPFATVKINGREVNQSYRIDIQRQYTVEVFGVNDYYHTYSFTFINENLEAYQQLIAPMIITAIGSLVIFFIRKRWVA